MTGSDAQQDSPESFADSAGIEANFDGLVGPTHNYAGLSHGNLASEDSRGRVASPRGAALEGLSKMKAVADLGIPQGLLPPQERPDLSLLRRLGFAGDDAAVLYKANGADPTLLAMASSASPMWVANAATVIPSADSSDGRLHLVVANLIAKGHRSIEPQATERALKATFPDRKSVCVHPALPAMGQFGDEGAANHTRFWSADRARGLHLFVYGQADGQAPGPQHFVARQRLAASEAVARLGQLDGADTIFAQQHPDAIDGGVFHNDVIAVGQGRLLFHHEKAFLHPEALLAELRERLPSIVSIEVPEMRVPLSDAVSSYLFNSQLLQIPGRKGLLLVAPIECSEVASVHRYLQDMTGPGQVIEEVRYFDLRQSMRNGGGPACLRLRVTLNRAERRAVNAASWLDDGRYRELVSWVERHYRPELSAADLVDPGLLDDNRRALDELTRLLGLGSLYRFQRTGAAGLAG